MKSIRSITIGLGLFTILFILPGDLPAQTAATISTAKSASPDSIVQLTAEAQGLSLVSRANLPPFGTYWLVMPRGAAPLPCPPLDQSLPIYAITGSQFIVDGTGGQSTSTNDLMAEATTVVNLINQAQSVQSRQMARTMALNGPSTPGEDDGDGGDDTNLFSSSYTIDTNQLWLELTNVANGVGYANLHNATNQVYAIWSTPDLTVPFADWQVETEVWPTDTNCQPFTVLTQDRPDLFLRAEDWTGVFTDGLPAWWTWLYFGNLSETATNLDGLGIPLGYDYTNDIDPNIIQFSLQFTNHYFNTSPAHGTITVSGGSPYYLAVLVNDTNYADAVWLPYTSTNVTVPLVDGDGIYQVQVGLRGLPADAQPMWLETDLTLDTSPPVVTITNPVASTVSTPMIQVQGFANETLSSLTFDVSNASGWFPNQTGYVIRQAYDTNLLKFTTNWFQCYDVVLTNGVNVITLHATDLAGNTATTNVSRTLNYAGVSNAPVLTVIWPPDGTLVAADQFTLQAQVDDATATVTATANSYTVQGQIERNGLVWLPGLSLNSGTNVVTVTAVNGAGKMTSTNLSVVGSAAGLTVAPIASDELNQPTVTVTGTVANPGDQVTVNGVGGYVYDEAGDWEVDGVPVAATGTANLNVELTDGAFNPLGELEVGQPQPATIALMNYQSSAHDSYAGVGEGDGHEDASYLWDYLSGGQNWGDFFLENQGDDDQNYSYDYSISAGLGAFEAYAYSPVYENISATGTFNNVAPYYSGFLGYYGPYSQQTQAQLMIVPSGQGLMGTTRLYLVGLSAMAFSDPYAAQGIRTAGDVPVDPTTLQVNGQPLTSSGLTNADGSTTGWALVAGPAGAPVPLTVTSSSAVNYSFATNLLQEISMQSLTVVSNSATQIDGTNWAVVKTTATNDYVIVQATLNNTNDWILTKAAPLIQWSGGEAVPGNPWQRRITKTNSLETTVTASLGSSTTNLSVWVIWATMSIQMNGTNTSPLAFANYDFPDEQLGLISYNSTSLGIVPAELFSYTNMIAGKICAVATITPPGVHTLITNEWDFFQRKNTTLFTNGVLASLNPAWTSDGPDSVGINKTIIPDIHDKLYSIDGPNLNLHDQSFDSVETYKNFYDYITWENQICCDTNSFWHYEARWKTNSMPPFTLANLGSGLINIQTNAYYPSP